MEVRTRRRNARGSGNLLRAEILAAAGNLLDTTGRLADLTLRQIATAAGVSAPAIYAHFDDREAILTAIVEQSWQQVVADIKAAAAPEAAPRERLLCGCRAYLAFGQRHPARYALMTESAGSSPAAREALGVLTRALAACQAQRGAHPDAARIAAALSTALHGAAMLNRTDAPSMWLSDVPPDEVLQTLVDSAIDRQNSPAEETR